jgi:GNAT superfamily N-acetyltransferase
MSNVVYAVEPQLTLEEFISVLQRSTLAERRPVDDPARIAGMLKNADVILTARVDGRLIGMARAITDFSYCSYLSDLAVDQHYQRRGVGRELLRRAHEACGLRTRLILLSAPAAVDYYPHIGMQQHPSCWIIPPQDETTRP